MPHLTADGRIILTVEEESTLWARARLYVLENFEGADDVAIDINEGGMGDVVRDEYIAMREEAISAFRFEQEAVAPAVVPPQAEPFEGAINRILQERVRANRVGIDWASFDEVVLGQPNPPRVVPQVGGAGRRGSRPAPMTTAAVTGKTTVNDAFLGHQPGASAFGYGEKRAEDHLKVVTPDPAIPYNHCVGVEIEIENVHLPDTTPESLWLGWDRKGDGSLRNGHEYVTRYGVTAPVAMGYIKMLDDLFDQAARSLSRDDRRLVNSISFRCGLHVHIDVQGLTFEELYRALLIYTVVEKLLFEASGKRHNNKFCVSVHDSVNSTQAAMYYGHRGEWKKFADCIFNGSKYMGLNIRTVRRFGTLEFRHHEGTSNPEVIRPWMLMLLDLVLASREQPIKELEDEILNLNTVSHYENFVRQHFPNSYLDLCKACNYERLMYSGVAHVKEAFITDPQLDLFELERD